jgi:uncharacterized heparinase superfamily protein
MAGLFRLPGTIAAEAVGRFVLQGLRDEWLASPAGRWLAARPRAVGFSIQPRDFRPADPEAGRRILAGVFVLAGATLPVGPRGDPFDRASPSRAFAEALHGFAWLRDLLPAGEVGEAEALRLYLDWRRAFGRWSRFSWAAPVLERRVFNLACGARAFVGRASDAEVALVANDLIRQACALLTPGDGPARAAERAAAAAVAGAALEGRGGEAVRRRALKALARALPRAVAPDGGHASRSPQAALELLFDLKTLEEALTQRGLAAPEPVLTAIDRLAEAVRFFTLQDGGLPAFHGGAACERAYVAAARAEDDSGDRVPHAACNGCHRLEGGALQVIVDAAPPAAGPWSLAARAQPMSFEILAGGRRLIGAGAGRGLEAGSCLSAAEPPFGRVLSGFAAGALGPRLLDAEADVRVERHEQPEAVWLELHGDAWLRRYGIIHQRRLFLNVGASELRGEDRLTPTARAQGPDGRHFIPYSIRFHLHPGVSALVSQDRRSVLLRAEGANAGWQLRNDALDVAVEPTVHSSGRPSQQIVLRGHRRADSGARVRWKLSPAHQAVDASPAAH